MPPVLFFPRLSHVVLLVAFLLLTVFCATASADFYVVAGGKRAKRVVLVSPVPGDQTASGQALLDAVAGSSGADADNPWLVLVEPGRYNLGSSQIILPDYVSLAGAGPTSTFIETSNISYYIEAGMQSEIRDLQLYCDTYRNFRGIQIPTGKEHVHIRNVKIDLGNGNGSTGHNTIGIDIKGNNSRIQDIEIIMESDYIHGIYSEGNDCIVVNAVLDLNAKNPSPGLECQSGDMTVLLSKVKIESQGYAYAAYTNGGELYVRNTLLESVNGSATAVFGAYISGANGGTLELDHCKILTPDGASDKSLRSDHANDTIYAASCMLKGEIDGPARTVDCYDESYVSIADGLKP